MEVRKYTQKEWEELEVWKNEMLPCDCCDGKFIDIAGGKEYHSYNSDDTDDVIVRVEDVSPDDA